jgi:3-deoxy-D-manno-octulosonic-acid transferase
MQALVAAASLCYAILGSLVVWAGLVPITLARVVLGAATLRELRERLGWVRLPARSAGSRVVVHGVSAGEVRAAAAFARALGEQRPDCHVVLTCGNPDGRSMAEAVAPLITCVEATEYLPWDRPAMASWLRALDCAAVVVVETEIWPALFRACRRAEVPLFVVSGRIYPRDVARYLLARPFFQAVLSHVSWIGAQSARDAEAFCRIGAPSDRVVEIGDLKMDVVGLERPIPPRQQGLFVETSPLILASSTHAPEDDMLIDVLTRLRLSVPGVRLVLAPRHVHRSAALVRVAESAGFRTVRWSSPGGDASAWDVLVVDCVGWLPSLYARADVVVVGGTFAPRGGHSPVEPALQGRAIVLGPHVDHVAPLVEALETGGGVVRIAQGAAMQEDLHDELTRLLRDHAARRELGTRAQHVCSRRQGASMLAAREVVERSPGLAAAGARGPAVANR